MALEILLSEKGEANILWPLPIVTLADAREKQMEAKKMLQNNIDPSKARKDTAH